MLLALALAADTAKLPAWGAEPPPGTEEAAVMAPVGRLLDAIGTGDARQLLAQVRPDGGATAAIENADGSRRLSRLSWTQFAGTIGSSPDHVAEHLIDPAIEIDGDIAMVWSSYVFTVNSRPSHCGADHFDLVREDGAWKILNFTWSQRTTGC